MITDRKRRNEGTSLIMKYQHVFFDLDHTLWDFDTNARESLQDLYEEFELKKKGIPNLEAFHFTYFKHNVILWGRLSKGYITRKELKQKRMWRVLLDFKITDTELAAAMENRYQEVLPTKKHLLPYAVEILDYLKNKGYTLHLITNGFKTSQHLKLQISGIGDYFGEMITSESVGKAKPHPEIFAYALERTGCEAHDALMVGDVLEIDVLGAQNAGMDTVYFNPEAPRGNRVVPTYHIAGLHELKEIL